MEQIDEIRRSYDFTAHDEETLKELAEIFLPVSDEFASQFASFLMDNPDTAGFLPSEAHTKRRKETIKKWFEELFTSSYNAAYVTRIWKIGKVHVKIGLKGNYVKASMNMVRNFCLQRINATV